MPPKPESTVPLVTDGGARRWLFGLGAVGLVLLGLMAFATELFHRPPEQLGVLLNGGSLTFQGANYGMQFQSPPRGFDAVLGVFPRRWQRALGWSPGSVGIYANGRPNLCFWLDSQAPWPNPLGLQYLLVDQQGFESLVFFDNPFQSGQLAGFGPPRWLEVCATPAFPRRGKTVRLRVVQSRPDGSRYDVAEFVVPNPARTTVPSWLPSQMPIEASVGAKRFILKQARVGVPDPKRLQEPPVDWEGRWAEFRFQVKEAGRTSWGWEVDRIELMDATGNQVLLTGKGRGALNGRLSYAEGDDMVVVHRWMLWSDESAWRMRVHFQNDSGGSEIVEYTFRPEFLARTK